MQSQHPRKAIAFKCGAIGCLQSISLLSIYFHKFILTVLNYKKRKKIQFTAGLEEKIKTDELSSLVYRYSNTFVYLVLILTIIYRVYPLPESLTDYVWDYGSLGEREEFLYIRSIVKNSMQTSNDVRDLFAELIHCSQEYIKHFIYLF